MTNLTCTSEEEIVETPQETTPGPNLLLHSMNEFRQVILSCLELAEARQIVEIGTEYGGMSTTLAHWLEPRAGQLWCIDPHPKEDFVASLPALTCARHIAKTSLDGLADVPCADAWLIDGDHNWYTVYHELHFILQTCRANAKHPLIFLHDVGWPCARRDMYYSPEQIPKEARRPFTYNAGVTPGQRFSIAGRGFRGGSDFAYADEEGGSRNGVLTAVEDALLEESQGGRSFTWCMIPAVFGLGIVFDAAAPWGESVASVLRAWHENPLIASLEQSRLANYLRVIEMQDTLL